MCGVGKNWSRGLTAATDPRVARNAAAHRGKVYQRRKPIEQDRRSVCFGLTAQRVPVGWSSVMAYVVGLVATDGCLVNDRRHVSFTTADRELAELFLRCLDRPPRFGVARTSAGNPIYRVQVGDVVLYRWLQSVGITPRKSLTLGPIDVPDHLFPDLARGLLDGDGTIRNFVHAPTLRQYPGYRYERLLVQFSSASRAHLGWVQRWFTSHLQLSGTLVTARRPGRHDFSSLTYGKRDSIRLLDRIYADPHAPRLRRKWQIWESYRLRTQAAKPQLEARPRVAR